MNDQDLKADIEAFQHIVFMELAKIKYEFDPHGSVSDHLSKLQRSKSEEKTRILNRFREGN